MPDDCDYDYGTMLNKAYGMLKMNGDMEDGISLLGAIELMGYTVKHHRENLFKCQELLEGRAPRMPYNFLDFRSRLNELCRRLIDKEKEMLHFKNGDEVIDKLSGYKGTVTGITKYLNGCIRAIVQPRVDKDGKMPEAEYIDSEQVEVTKSKEFIEDSSKLRSVGGPTKSPKVSGISERPRDM